MRSPFQSETEAFETVLLVVVALIPIVLAAALGPTWLALAVVAVVICALIARVVQLRMRRLRGIEIPVKMAPAHVGPQSERRVLVVANDTLQESALVGEVKALTNREGTSVLLLVPAVVSKGDRLTGSIDDSVAEARGRLSSALERIGRIPSVAGQVSQSSPLQAVEDAFATFAPDEVIVCTRPAHGAHGLEPALAPLVRERFAVPVRHLVFEPHAAAAREADSAAERHYRSDYAEASARRFGLRALATAGIAAAVVMSAVAMIHSSERNEAHAAAQSAAEQAALAPKVAQSVSLKVIAEYKPGPEGEKHDAFTTTEFTVGAGRPQQLVIDNTDDVPHSITAPGAGVNITVMPGTHAYTLTVKTPGRYLWFCAYVCDEWAMQHPGYMSGYINVV